MTFGEILDQVLDLLQREKRLSYRALKVRFGLDDEHLAALKDEIIEAKQLAMDDFLTKLAPRTLHGVKVIQRRDASKVWAICSEIRGF